MVQPVLYLIFAFSLGNVAEIRSGMTSGDLRAMGVQRGSSGAWHIVEKDGRRFEGRKMGLRLRGGVGKQSRPASDEKKVGGGGPVDEGVKGKIERKEKSRGARRKSGQKETLSEARRRRKVLKREEKKRERMKMGRGQDRQGQAAQGQPSRGWSNATDHRMQDDGDSVELQYDKGGSKEEEEEDQEEEEEEDVDVNPEPAMGKAEQSLLAAALPPEALLRPFWDSTGRGRDLASLSAPQRKMAEDRLMKALNGSDSLGASWSAVESGEGAGSMHEHLAYVAQRLVKGLSSPRDMAGVGFCDALMRLLSVYGGNGPGRLAAAHVMSLTDQHLDFAPANLDTSQVAGLSGGHFNAVLAVAKGMPAEARSGELLADLCTRLLRIIVRVGAHKPLSLACAELFMDLASEMADGVAVGNVEGAGRVIADDEARPAEARHAAAMPELQSLVVPRLASAIGTTDRKLHATELLLVLRMQRGPAPAISRALKGWVRQTGSLLGKAGHVTRLVPTLENATMPGNSSLLHPVWHDVVFAACEGDGSQAAVKLLWDSCVAPMPLSLQLQVLALLASSAPPPSLALILSLRPSGAPLDHPPLLASALVKSLSLRRGGDASRLVCQEVELRASRGELAEEGAGARILTALTEASPNFDAVTGTRVVASLLGGKSVGEDASRRHLLSLALAMGRQLSRGGEGYLRYGDALVSSAVALGGESAQSVKILFARMALFRWGKAGGGLWDAVVEGAGGKVEELEDAVRKTAFSKLLSLGDKGGAGMRGVDEVCQGWIQDARFNTAVRWSAELDGQMHKLGALYERVTEKEAVVEALCKTVKNAEGAGGADGVKGQSAKQGQGITAEMLVQLRLLLLYDGGSEGVCDAVKSVCERVEGWLLGDEQGGGGEAVCSGVLALLEKESVMLRDLALRIFKCSVHEMGEESLVMILRVISGEGLPGADDGGDDSDDFYFSSNEKVGSSGVEGMQEGDDSKADKSGEMEDFDISLPGDSGGEGQEDKMQGVKDVLGGGRKGEERGEDGEDEENSEGGHWAKDEFNVALSQAESEDLRDFDKRMVAAQRLKTSALQHEAQSLHLRAKSVELLDVWVKSHAGHALSFKLINHVITQISVCYASKRASLASLHDRMVTSVTKRFCNPSFNPPPGPSSSSEAGELVKSLLTDVPAHSAIFADVCIAGICWSLKSVDDTDSESGQACLRLIKESITNATTTRKGGLGLKLFRALSAKNPSWAVRLLDHMVASAVAARSAYLREEALAAISLCVTCAPEVCRPASLLTLSQGSERLIQAVSGACGGGGEAKKGRHKLVKRAVAGIVRVLQREGGCHEELVKELSDAVSRPKGAAGA